MPSAPPRNTTRWGRQAPPRPPTRTPPRTFAPLPRRSPPWPVAGRTRRAFLRLEPSMNRTFAAALAAILLPLLSLTLGTGLLISGTATTCPALNGTTPTWTTPSLDIPARAAISRERRPAASPGTTATPNELRQLAANPDCLTGAGDGLPDGPGAPPASDQTPDPRHASRHSGGDRLGTRPAGHALFIWRRLHRPPLRQPRPPMRLLQPRPTGLRPRRHQDPPHHIPASRRRHSRYRPQPPPPRRPHLHPRSTRHPDPARTRWPLPRRAARSRSSTHQSAGPDHVA